MPAKSRPVNHMRAVTVLEGTNPMRLTPSQASSSSSPQASAVTSDRDRNVAPFQPEAESWRWAVIHFPCLEGITPRGEIIMVSDKRHIAEARRKYPDLVLWHEKELALFGEHMDHASLDEPTFVAVNRLKLKTRGWFMGVEGGKPAVSGDTAKGQG